MDVDAAGTPWAVRPVCSAPAGELDRPATSSEKKTPMDRTMPPFWNVARMPDATPRCEAGNAFITAVVLGAENRPEPMPLNSSSTANTG